MMSEKPRLPKSWHNNENLVAIYCAAISGFVANKYFHEASFQGSPKAAHDFAIAVVTEAWGETESTFPT